MKESTAAMLTALQEELKKYDFAANIYICNGELFVTYGEKETEATYDFSHWFSCCSYMWSKQFPGARLNVGEFVSFANTDEVTVIQRLRRYDDTLPSER